MDLDQIQIQDPRSRSKTPDPNTFFIPIPIKILRICNNTIEIQLKELRLQPLVLVYKIEMHSINVKILAFITWKTLFGNCPVTAQYKEEWGRNRAKYIYLVWLRNIPETILFSSIPAKFSIGRLPLAPRQESSYLYTHPE